MAKPKQPKARKFDPVATLREIAADPEVAAHARVSACRALLAHDDAADAEPGKDAAPNDAITRRALKLLQGGKS